MSSIRLFVLGALLERGPLHGYDIRRIVEDKHMHSWTDVGLGGLYGTLGRLEREGFVREVRTEKAGSRPERRVFGITEAGEVASRDLRDRTITDYHLVPDPVDIAYFWPEGTPDAHLRDLLRTRRLRVLAELEACQDRIGDPRVERTQRETAVMRHSLFRIRADLAWIDEILIGSQKT